MSDTIPYFERMKLIKLGIAPKESVAKPKKSIAKKSAKKILEEKESKEANEMDMFFEDARKQMTGKCFICGGKTEKDNEKNYKCSIAHLFPKSKFPSIATHPINRIELCYYGKSCHTNFDNRLLTFEYIKINTDWTIIVNKFRILSPLLTNGERATKFYSHLENLITDT